MSMGLEIGQSPSPRNAPAVSFILILPPLSPEKAPAPSSRGILPEDAESLPTTLGFRP